MDKLTSIRIKYSDGTYLDEVPIGVLAQNVGYDSGHNLIQVLGSVDVDSNGTIQQQINRLFNEKLNTSDLSSYVNSKITTDVSKWLADNVNPVGSAVIVDQSLSISGAAADAKITGDEVNTLKSIVTKQLSSIVFSPNLVKGQYIKLSNGRKYNSSNYARTLSLWYGAGQRYAISVTNPNYSFNLMFYDQNGNLDDGTGYIKGTDYVVNDIILVPSNAIYFGMNFRRVDEQAITDDDIVTIQNSILYFALTDKTLTQEDKAADAKTVGDEISALKNTAQTMGDEIGLVKKNIESYNIAVSITDYTLVMGTINGAAGYDSDATNRCRTSNFIHFEGINMRIVAADGYKISGRKYSEANIQSYISSAGAWDNELIVDDNTKYYRLVIAKTDDSAFNISDLPEDVIVITAYKATDTTLSIPNKVADAKTVGDEVNTLKSIATKQFSPVVFSPNLTKGQYIRLSDGKKYSSSNYARTSSLWYGAGQRYAISVTNPNYSFNLMFYDQNGNLDNGNGYIKGTDYTINDIIIVPSYAVYFGMNFRRVDEQAITDDDIVAIRASILRFALTDKTLTQEDKAADAKTVGDEISALKNTYFVDKTSGTIIDYYIGIDEGTIRQSSLTVKTVYFSCLPNVYYMLEHGDAGVFVVACYDRVPTLNLNATKFVNDRGRTKTIFKTDSTAQYLAVYYYSSKFNSETPEEVFNGLEIKTIGFDSVIDFMVNAENKDEVVSVAHDFYISGDGVSLASTFDDVVELYDELVISYPEYVTKNTLTSGTLVNYEYVFTTGDYNAKNGRRNQEPRITKPVILLLSGIHGYERSAVMSLYTVMKHMCENNYELADVIGYATIKVIPVGNPWSYTNNSRVNANGVNINRNFDAPEWESDGEGTTDYSGAEPADQDETQIIQNWILANSDAILFIDFHNSVYTNEISCLMSSNLAHQSDYKRKYLLGMNKIIPYFIKEKGIIDENTIYCYTGGSRSFNDRGRQAVSYAYRHGIEDAFVHESSWNVNNTGKHSKISIGTGAEVIGNMLIAFKSYYENIVIIPWTPE